ncbi:hypothetical protein LXL04_027897 [Taraxacum kok-saghyz]
MVDFEFIDLCSKTSLKLATSRIKLMKNKKLIQINQMKRELAQSKFKKSAQCSITGLRLAVAKEHNINWDPTLFEDTESKVSDDLLKGPMNFEEQQNVRDDFSQQNRRYTLGTHNITSTDTNPSGMASEMMNRRHSFHNNSNNNSSSGKDTNWDMGFKDATSAAQAAAESAERASMAARAAAQLSSQGKHSSQSHQSPKASNTSQVPGRQNFKESYNNSFKDRNPKIQNPQKNPSEEHGSHRDDKSETDSDDDDENRKFDTGFEYDEGEAKSFFPSPDREEITRPIEYTHISSPKNNASDKKDLQKANSRKSRNELNDLVERSSSVYEDEDKRTQPRNSSRVSQRHEEEKKNDDFDSGNELKFGTLTGGRRNNGGLVYPPYTNTGVTNSSHSSKKLDYDQASKPSSFNSRASRLETKGQSVSRSSSESESDDRIEKYLKSGSPFAPPESFFNDDEYADSDEEAQPVPKPTSTGLSRRTKDHVKPKGKTVISNSTETRRSGMQHDRDMNPESPLNSRSKQEISEANQGDKISEQQPKPRKKMVGSGEMEARKTADLRSERLVEENDVKKPSHVHPKLPEYDSLAARIQSLRANRQ